MGGFFVYWTLAWSEERWYGRKRNTKKGWIAIGCVAGASVAALLIVFFVLIWLELSKALIM